MMRNQVESQAKQLEDQVGYCQQHQNLSELACLTCRCRVCPHCALFGSHKGHEVREEKEAQALMKEHSDQLKLLIPEFTQMIAELGDKPNYWKHLDKYRAKKEELKLHIQNEF